MKATELMIGDWVDIQEEGKHLKFTKVHSLTASYDETYYFPIPLTPEILESNGFKLDEKYRTQYGWVINEAHIGDTYFVIHTCEDWVHDPKKYINIWVKCDGYVRPSDYHIMYPEYVHELQHALRLCGLNDIADNFKVES